MTKLPVVSSAQLVAALGKAGLRPVSGRDKGSHRFLHREEPPTGITVPHKKEIKRGTLRAILRQAGLSVQEFVRLMRGGKEGQAS